MPAWQHTSKNLFSVVIALSLTLASFAAPSGDAYAQVALHPPDFAYSKTLGCGDVFFHAVNDTATEILRIEADFAQLSNVRSRDTFDLAHVGSAVVVTVTVYSDGEPNRPNCSDVFVSEPGRAPIRQEVWQAVDGTLTIDRGPKDLDPQLPYFKAAIRLDAVAFRGPRGEIVQMTEPFEWEGMVGWSAGWIP